MPKSSLLVSRGHAQKLVRTEKHKILKVLGQHVAGNADEMEKNICTYH